MLDHALTYAKQGYHVFPCTRFLGLPHLDNWYKLATADQRDRIVQWWSEDPIADIAAVPEKSGHYVIVVTGEAGRDNLAQFEEEHGILKPVFRYRNVWDAEHLWFKGEAFTARIDEGLHLIGSGRYMYLAPSWAPDATAWKE